MRVLAIHNRYQQSGGEDIAFSREVGLLRSKGDEVAEYVRSNDELAEQGWADWVGMPATIVWSRRSYREVLKIIDEFRPHVAHFHNTFLAVSPSAYHACKERGVPVVQSVHNPRLICPSANLYRSGGICTECVGRRFAWPAVLHSCYRDSSLFSLGAAWLTAAHRLLSTWNGVVDRYIVFTEFYRRLLSEAGLPASKIVVKPHFLLSDPGEREQDTLGNYAMYAGRLEPAKGARTLLDAWYASLQIPLVVAGDGSLLQEYQSAGESRSGQGLTLTGKLPWGRLVPILKQSRFLVWPSAGLNETFGNIAMEAMACGVPVLAASIGVAPEVVKDGVTGLLFKPSDSVDLASKMDWAWNHPDQMLRFGRNARQDFERRFTADENYVQLRNVYAGAIKGRRAEYAERTAACEL